MTRDQLRLLLVVVVGWVWLPFIPFSVLGDANTALLYAIPAVSLVLLTGWVGQISLAQAAFVGIGAFGTAFLARRGLSIPFPFSVPVMGMLSAAMAMLLGVVALRVRGLYLAVATLIFGWMADSYLFGSPWFAGAGGSATIEVPPVGTEGTFPYFDFSDRRIFYYAALAALGVAIVGLINLRQSKTGRAFFAIRGSETAAASLGINVTRYKLLAFGISGFIAGMAGNIIITGQGTIVPAQFNFTIALFYLAVAVVGGLQSLGGAVASGVLFAMLNELFYRVQALHGWLEVVSAGLLAAVLLFYPGGLAAVPGGVGAVMRRWVSSPSRLLPVRTARWLWRNLLRRILSPVFALAHGANKAWKATRRISGATLGAVLGRLPVIGRRRGTTDTSDGEIPDMLGDLALAAPKTVESPSDERPDPFDPANIPEFNLPRTREDRRLMLEAEKVTVRFGGLTAVDDAHLKVRQGEIVGLIGPNGAGKTTLFNAMAGFNSPQSGQVFLGQKEITRLQVHERAALGIGRTFQLIQLFPQLSVFENLLVATHIRNKTGFISHLVVTAKAGRAEARAIERVKKVIELLGLEEVADRRVAGLPFGTLRMVEVGRALVTGSPLIMLDEPASGLDSAETHRFANLLRFLRAKLGLSILLIEHDVSLVMAVCDYVYVIDRGKLIAEGTPAEVQNDPAVVAAYLGSSGEQATRAQDSLASQTPALATDGGKAPSVVGGSAGPEDSEEESVPSGARRA